MPIGRLIPHPASPLVSPVESCKDLPKFSRLATTIGQVVNSNSSMRTPKNGSGYQSPLRNNKSFLWGPHNPHILQSSQSAPVLTPQIAPDNNRSSPAQSRSILTLKMEHILTRPEFSPHLTKIFNAMFQKDIGKLNELKTELPIAENVIQAYLHTKFIMDIIPVKAPQETIIKLEKYANNVAPHEQPFIHAAMKLAIEQRLGLIERYAIDVGPKFAQLAELEKNLPEYFKGLLARLAPDTKTINPNEPPPQVVLTGSSTSKTPDSYA